jgi:lipopolysaccharide transport system ATP-binding protein
VNAAVVVEQVTKRFVTGAPHTIRDAIVGRARHRRHRTVALDAVDLTVAPGEAVALVGPNGAGKSTLLRLIGGVGRPDAGTIAVQGRIGALLELGTGFHPDLTGRENAQLGLVVSGLGRADARDRVDDVAEFAGLTSVLDHPMRTYSTGMRARLGFAVGVHADADILLVDEVLAVGDIAFQQQCLDRVGELRRAGATVLLASHSPDLVAAMCDRAVWLRAGRVIVSAAPAEVAARYAAAVASETAAATPAGASLAEGDRWGTQESTVEDVALSDATVVSGAPLIIELTVARGGADVRRLNLSISIVRGDGTVCVDENAVVETLDARTPLRLHLERLDLAPDDYAVDVGLYAEDWSTTFDYHHRAHHLRVSGARRGKGALQPPVRWERDAQRWLLGSSTSS